MRPVTPPDPPSVAATGQVLVALALQAIIAIPSGNLWMGAAAGAFYFIGREYAQAEYRNIEANYGRKLANMPWWGGLQRRAWTTKGMLDWMLPAAVVCLVAYLKPMAL